jgi:hypothetical protein
MNSAFMCYYEHLAKLARVANKQTMFLAHMLYRMEWNAEANQMVVTLTAFDKRAIMKSIDSDTVDANRLANQYLLKLKNANLIKPLGGGAFLVDPASFGGHKYVNKKWRTVNSAIYETRVFMSDNEGEQSAYIVTDDGEKVDLT